MTLIIKNFIKIDKNKNLLSKYIKLVKLTDFIKIYLIGKINDFIKIY